MRVLFCLSTIPGAGFVCPRERPVLIRSPRFLVELLVKFRQSRDLFNCYGTFYELPAENAGGFAKIRPIATHSLWITDYCSWRGLLVITGIATGFGGENEHIIRSEDGKSAVWVGAVDDLWQLGKPIGHGGPWKDSSVSANCPSDRYLMTGYDNKRLMLSHESEEPVTVHVEVDITGNGQWQRYKSFDVARESSFSMNFLKNFRHIGSVWFQIETRLFTGQFIYD